MHFPKLTLPAAEGVITWSTCPVYKGWRSQWSRRDRVTSSSSHSRGLTVRTHDRRRARVRINASGVETKSRPEFVKFQISVLGTMPFHSGTLSKVHCHFRHFASLWLSGGKPVRALQAKREASSHCSSRHWGMVCSAPGEEAFDPRVQFGVLKQNKERKRKGLWQASFVHS